MMDARQLLLSTGRLSRVDTCTLGGAGRIEQYGFVEGVDYVVVSPNSGENPSGGRPSTDYHLSLDMANWPTVTRSFFRLHPV